MSLPWFAFKIADYVKDTMRLSTEGHGCYLLLILDYYANEEPPPDDDDVLASICKLPVATWQAKHRKVLAPFFRVEGGFWHHDRIQREMLEASSKHNKAVDRAVKAAAASAAVRSASSQPQAGKRKKQPPSQLVADPEPASRGEHLQEHIHPPSGGEEAPPTPKIASQGLGSPITRDWVPTTEARTAALAAAITDEEFGAEVRKFVATKTADGAFSNDWDASFTLWIEREIQFREKRAKAATPKAAPRIEVDVKPDWDQACVSWAKFRSWPRGIGADPESPACRAPLDVRAKHGIDASGNVAKVKV